MSRFKLPNEKTVVVGTPFEYKGNLYPANFLQLATAEEKAEIGLVEIVEETPVDGRFYYSADLPRPIEQCRTALVSRVKDYVSSNLAQTDWMIIRAADGIPVPSDIVQYRQTVREQGNVLVDEIANISTAAEAAAWQMHDMPAIP